MEVTINKGVFSLRRILDDIFSEESEKRHFIMLAISIALGIWTYIALGLISGWDWIAKGFEKKDYGLAAFGEFGLSLALAGCFGILVYWCCRLWMVKFLIKAFLGLFGWVPFANRLDPDWQYTSSGKKYRIKKLRKKIRKADPNDPKIEVWQAEINRLAESMTYDDIFDQMQDEQDAAERKKAAREEAREDRREIRRRLWLNPQDDYWTVKGEYEAEKGAEGLAGCLLAPFSLILMLLMHLLKVLAYLVCSVGIPVLTPLGIAIVGAIVSGICGENHFALFMTALVLLVIVICTLIVHPIIAAVRNRY